MLSTPDGRRWNLYLVHSMTMVWSAFDPRAQTSYSCWYLAGFGLGFGWFVDGLRVIPHPLPGLTPQKSERSPHRSSQSSPKRDTTILTDEAADDRQTSYPTQYRPSLLVATGNQSY